MRKFFKKTIPDCERMLTKGSLEVGFFGGPYRQITSEIWESCAKLYCQIWREPPWNEDFWEESEVLADIRRELKKPGAESFLAVQSRLAVPVTHGPDIYSIQAIGFTWGYLINREDAREISKGKLLDSLFDKGETIFYIDELAVSCSARNRKIGETLSLLIVDYVKRKGSEKVILRTDKKALAARRLYSKVGFEDLKVEDSAYPERTYWCLEF